MEILCAAQGVLKRPGRQGVRKELSKLMTFLFNLAYVY